MSSSGQKEGIDLSCQYHLTHSNHQNDESTLQELSQPTSLLASQPKHNEYPTPTNPKHNVYHNTNTVNNTDQKSSFPKSLQRHNKQCSIQKNYPFTNLPERQNLSSQQNVQAIALTKIQNSPTFPSPTSLILPQYSKVNKLTQIIHRLTPKTQQNRFTKTTQQSKDNISTKH
ncbi:MAG: hypothetical protein Q8881_02375 [Sweet potato little leaf phytoplasma]|nr:hypothetical protein [Sweet potato little leaf phytoplasma]